MLGGKIQRLAAMFILAGFVSSTSLAITAEASSRQHESAQEQRLQNKREEQRIQHQKAEQRRQHEKDEQRIQRQRDEQRRQHEKDEQRRQYQRDEQRRHYQKDGRNDNESHSDTGNLVTGLIIGGVLGAVIANS
ncbi:MAG: hypothetical protein PHH31_00530 [Acidaminococcaceae bacterium]|nr:hypothetical protein [Acidaminococcaceae bacterium]